MQAARNGTAASRCTDAGRLGGSNAAPETSKPGKSRKKRPTALASLDPERADAEKLLKLVREHWGIETRPHSVRDFTYDEDRCRARAGHTPRNLACVSNLAIAIIRLDSRFE